MVLEGAGLASCLGFDPQPLSNGRLAADETAATGDPDVATNGRDARTGDSTRGRFWSLIDILSPRSIEGCLPDLDIPTVFEGAERFPVGEETELLTGVGGMTLGAAGLVSGAMVL